MEGPPISFKRDKTARTAVYIDAFNLYYGLARPLNCKWVNIRKLFETTLSQDDVQVIRFFTSVIDGPGGTRQRTYIDCLQALGKVQVHEGYFQEKTSKCMTLGCRFPGSRFYTHAQEKQTDVGMATQIIHDAHQGIADKIVIVTGDADVVPAIRLLRAAFPNIVLKAYIPSLGPPVDKERSAARLVRNAIGGGNTKLLAYRAFIASQLPEIVTVGTDVFVRPMEWRQAPQRAFADVFLSWKAEQAAKKAPP